MHNTAYYHVDSIARSSPVGPVQMSFTYMVVTPENEASFATSAAFVGYGDDEHDARDHIMSKIRELESNDTIRVVAL